LAVYGPGSRGCRKGERQETYLQTFTISRHGGLRHSECLSSRLDFAALVVLFIVTTAGLASLAYYSAPLIDCYDFPHIRTCFARTVPYIICLHS